ncbi:MAG: 4Fe-4S dicluster domain-containing protein, partial [Deltaproteobacteria bacterium]|nr:4Fe-4S dicluster domain-containing protein [Deltaproteobacteria bacterium]
GCLRCGRCVRACAAAGGEAISLVGRGAGRRVMGPFDRPPVSCLGCLACVRVCPTGIIKFKDDPQSRSVWGRDFEVLSCPSCGRPVGTLEELSRAGADKLCPKCRIRAAGEAFGSVPAPLA